MKKYFIPIALLVTIAACNSNSDTAKNADTTGATTAPAADDLSSNPDYQKGLALITANDCLGCHKIEEKLTGPAYREVANKYDNTDANVKMLAEKILKGGSGNWGEIPMAAHPAVSEADAEQMVKYILLLRNK